jgi:hypothetical protein
LQINGYAGRVVAYGFTGVEIKKGKLQNDGKRNTSSIISHQQVQPNLLKFKDMALKEEKTFAIKM